MADLKITIGKNIRILRKQKGLTLQSLSKQIGITYQQLSRIENGLGTSTTTLERIATILEVDIEALMEDSEETLKRTIPKYQNYVPDWVCQQINNTVFERIIAVVNENVLEIFTDKIATYTVQFIKNFKASIPDSYREINDNRLPEEDLGRLCQKLILQFSGDIINLSKRDSDFDISDDIAEDDQFDDLIDDDQSDDLIDDDE